MYLGDDVDGRACADAGPDASVLDIDGLDVALRRLPGAVRHRPSRRPRRDRVDHRGQRCRQVDAAQDDRRSRADRCGAHHLRRHVARRRCPPTVASQPGIALVPEGRRIFPSLTVEENIAIGAHARSDRGRGTRKRVLDAFPLLERVAEAQQRRPVGWRAAGARHRPRADVEPRSAAPRRGVARPGADRREAGVPGDPGDQGAGHDGAASSSRTSTRRSQSPIASTACSKVGSSLAGRARRGHQGADHRRATSACRRTRSRGAEGSARDLGQRRSCRASCSAASTRCSPPVCRWRSASCASSTSPTATSPSSLRSSRCRCSTRWSINPLHRARRRPAAGVRDRLPPAAADLRPCHRCRPRVSDRRDVRSRRSSSRTCSTRSTRPTRRASTSAGLETSSIKITDTISIGWLPLITLLCADRRARRPGAVHEAHEDSGGRSERPPTIADAARLMGIDVRTHLRRRHGAGGRDRGPRRGVWRGSLLVRSRSSARQRLIFAFEAVVIGGLGSLWGTLIGGIILGVSQSIGRQIDPQWGELAGHARVPDRAGRSGRPACSGRASCDEPTSRVSHVEVAREHDVRAVVAGRGRLAVIVPCGACRRGAMRRCNARWSSCSRCCRWRRCGTCWPGSPAWCRWASRRSSASAPTRWSPSSTCTARTCTSSVPISALIAAVLSVPLGLVAFRLSGSYFAIGTWVLAEVVSLVIIQQTSLGAGNGVSLEVAGYDLETRQRRDVLARPDRRRRRSVAAGLPDPAVAASVCRCRRSATTRPAARGLGANVYRTRFMRVGRRRVLDGVHRRGVLPRPTCGCSPRDSFSVVQWTAPIIFIVVIGGIGTIEGPIIGAVLYYFLPRPLRRSRDLRT